MLRSLPIFVSRKMPGWNGSSLVFSIRMSGSASECILDGLLASWRDPGSSQADGAALLAHNRSVPTSVQLAFGQTGCEGTRVARSLGVPVE